MKHILTMLLCLLTIAAGAQSFEKGVTKTLADYRTRTVSNVSYDLTFNIPATQKERVHGTAIISFFLQEKAVVVLDFQGRFSGACLVNGKKRVAGMKNEHIIIPLKMTKKGLNSIEMNFVCHDKALNRHSDYVYTLFAPGQAQQCFPCFDQPDLRARFTTQMNVPKDWKTIASDSDTPIPTSLYTFVAGRFEELQQRTREGYQMSVLHREQAPEKVKQLPKIIEETSQSLRWMESYTGVRYPFEAFSMVILPDYQPGGMELPGAMLLTDKHLFLSEKPSHNEQLRRRELIAHETAHQWFGSIVTLKQAEEAWTKEVLVNFMASKMTRQQLSKSDYDLNFLSTYQARAMALDCREATHPIAQRQDKPNHTTKLYDDIIYDKAPVMMRILEDIIGQKELQTALQQYIRDFYYKSASWDDLVAIIDRQAPQAGSWSLLAAEVRYTPHLRPRPQPHRHHRHDTTHGEHEAGTAAQQHHPQLQRSRLRTVHPRRPLHPEATAAPHHHPRRPEPLCPDADAARQLPDGPHPPQLLRRALPRHDQGEESPDHGDRHQPHDQYFSQHATE